MTYDIGEIQRKFGVSREGAALILSAIIETEMPLHVVAVIYKTVVGDANRYVTAGMLLQAIRAYNATKMSNMIRKGTKDRMDTRYISRPRFDEDNKRSIEDKGKKRSIDTHKLFRSDEFKEKMPNQSPAIPKYYYVDLDERFQRAGYDLPPSYDKQFKGYHDVIPYVKVTEVKVIHPSHYKKPIIGEVDGKKVIIGEEKTEGRKYFNLELFFNGISTPTPYNIPYEGLPGFDNTVGRDALLSKVREILDQMMTPDMKKVYEMIRRNEKNMTLMDHVLSNLDMNKQIQSEILRQQYYGNYEEEDRKHKRTKLLMRRIIKKKPVKKVKCNCQPKQNRKIIIKKKIVRRVGK